MKITITTPMKTLAGAPILDPDKQSVTLQTVSIEALMAFPIDDADKTMSGKQKAALHSLAERFYQASEAVEMTAEEVTLLKERIGKAYGPLIVGQAWRMLEG
jgi:hypothetical protein